MRRSLSRITYRNPDEIADGIRLCASIELWNELAIHSGATAATKNAKAKTLKTELSLIVRRRNIIAHEGDLRGSTLREPWPIGRADLTLVRDHINVLVRAIDAVVV